MMKLNFGEIKEYLLPLKSDKRAFFLHSLLKKKSHGLFYKTWQKLETQGN